MTSEERIQLIQDRLAVLAPSMLEVIDEGKFHVGHTGSQSGAGHYGIVIHADVFENKPLVTCHRMIYDALGDMMGPEIHALRIKIV
jgi:BolA protein